VAQLLDVIVAEPLERPSLVVDMSRRDGIESVAALRADPIRALPRVRRDVVFAQQEVELTNTRYLLFVDADAVPAPEWARTMREGFVEDVAVVRHHLRPERARWRWMLGRARVAGREAGRAGSRPEPLPRRLDARDYAFLAAIAPAYFAGRLGARGRGRT